MAQLAQSMGCLLDVIWKQLKHMGVVGMWLKFHVPYCCNLQ